jgi:hypothetical protein
MNSLFATNKLPQKNDDGKFTCLEVLYKIYMFQLLVLLVGLDPRNVRIGRKAAVVGHAGKCPVARDVGGPGAILGFGVRAAQCIGTRLLTTPSRTPPMRKLPVAPICRTHRGLLRRANQNHALAHPASMKRDVSADRHEPWGGDAVDAEGTSDERD